MQRPGQSGPIQERPHELFQPPVGGASAGDRHRQRIHPRLCRAHHPGRREHDRLGDRRGRKIARPADRLRRQAARPQLRARDGQCRQRHERIQARPRWRRGDRRRHRTHGRLRHRAHRTRRRQRAQRRHRPDGRSARSGGCRSGGHGAGRRRIRARRHSAEGQGWQVDGRQSHQGRAGHRSPARRQALCRRRHAQRRVLRFVAGADQGCFGPRGGRAVGAGQRAEGHRSAVRVAARSAHRQHRLPAGDQPCRHRCRQHAAAASGAQRRDRGSDRRRGRQRGRAEAHRTEERPVRAELGEPGRQERHEVLHLQNVRKMGLDHRQRCFHRRIHRGRHQPAQPPAGHVRHGGPAARRSHLVARRQPPRPAAERVVRDDPHGQRRFQPARGGGIR